MGATPTVESPARTLRVGVVAEPAALPIVAAALDACVDLEFVAHAGMARNEGFDSVEWFDDRRVLVTQAEIDVVIFATDTRAEVELSVLAAERGLHCLRRPPLARNFAEAVSVARRVAAASGVYALASWWDAAAGSVRDALAALTDWRPIHAELRVVAAGPPLASWRSGAVEAGGGVLMQDAYPLLEALVALRRLPDAVYGVVGRYRRPVDQPLRETEDLAAALLRYEGGGTALLNTEWDVAGPQAMLRQHAGQQSLELTATALRLVEGDRTTELVRLDSDPWPDALARLTRAIFAEDQRAALKQQIERHLQVNALIEAAYLSARTCHPEAPRNFYGVQGWPEPRS